MTRVLVVDQPQAELDIVGAQVLRLRYVNQQSHRADKQSHRIGLAMLEQLILLGDVQVSSKVLRACWEAGIDIILLPKRGRQSAINILPASPKAVQLRHQQHLLFADPEARLALACQFVCRKIEQQATWLTAHGYEPNMARFIKAANAATDIATLMGCEGAASARYFKYWGKLWQKPWLFNGRNRQPPQDPINALLSLSYTLTLSFIGRLAGRTGLEPALGFLHGPQRNRPALALDLIEPIRPRIDHWIWQWLQQTPSPLRPEHFSYSQAEGCRLSKSGRTVFFNQWYRTEQDWLEPASRSELTFLMQKLDQYNNNKTLN